jgi:hypothetical protein
MAQRCFYVPDHRRGGEGTHSTFSSFDMNDGDNDGLLGPQALRDRDPPDRVQVGFPSSPGMRGHSRLVTVCQQPGQQDPSQDLSRSRERPPPATSTWRKRQLPVLVYFLESDVEMNAEHGIDDSRWIRRHCSSRVASATDFDPSSYSEFRQLSESVRVAATTATPSATATTSSSAAAAAATPTQRLHRSLVRPPWARICNSSGRESSRLS